MKTLTFLLSTVIELYTMVVLLRVWMQWARCDFYNPFSQFVVKATQPIVGPLRRIIPAMGPIDSASLLVAFILCVIKAIVLFMVITFQPIIWISALLILLKTIGSLIFWVLLLMAIMSWVSGAVARWVCADAAGGPAAAPYPQPAAVDGRYRFLADGAGTAVVRNQYGHRRSAAGHR